MRFSKARSNFMILWCENGGALYAGVKTGAPATTVAGRVKLVKRVCAVSLSYKSLSLTKLLNWYKSLSPLSKSTCLLAHPGPNVAIWNVEQIIITIPRSKGHNHRSGVTGHTRARAPASHYL